MPVVESILLGAAATGAAYVGLNRRASRSVVSERLEGELRFPYPLGPDSRRPKDDLTLESAGGDKLAKELFLAGARTMKPVRFTRLLRKAALAIPLLVVLLAFLTGGLSSSTAVIAGTSAGVFWAYGSLFARMRRRRFERSIQRSLPQFLDLLVVCMEAGFAFPAALERMLGEVDGRDPLAKEFRRMYQEFLAGFSLAQACERMARRLEVSDVTLLLSAVIQAEQMGSSLGSTLRIQARELRDKARQRARGRALQIPVKMLFPMMLIFVSLFGMTLGPAFYQLGKVLSRTTPEAVQRANSGR